MRYAFSSNEQAVMRHPSQAVKMYAAIHQPRKLEHLSLSVVPNNHPVSAIRFSGTVSNPQSIDSGYTMLLGSASGASDLGKVRIRGSSYTDASGASLIPVMEAGSGLINWNEVTDLTVIEQRLPWVKHPRFDESANQWRMDYDVPWQTSVIGPYINMGPPIVGFLEGGSFSASFIGEDSLFWDNGSLTTVWYFPDDSNEFTIGTRSNPVTKTFTGASPNGSYIRLAVIDQGGASYNGYRLIFLFEDENQLHDVVTGRIDHDVESGGRAFLTINGASGAVEPDQEVVVFHRAWYGNEAASAFGGNTVMGAPVLFRGWIARDTIQRQPVFNIATFEAESLGVRMDKAKSKAIFHARSTDTGGPASNWVAQPNLSLDRVVALAFKYRSTVAEIADFHPMSGIGLNDGLILYQSLPEGPFWTQMKANYGDVGVIGMLSTDMEGNIWAYQDVQISGGSNSLVTGITLDDNDLSEMTIERSFISDNAHVQLEAVSSATPLGAESPGTLDGYWGGNVQMLQGLTTQSQDQLITWAGNMRAKLNNEYKNVGLTFNGFRRLDPVPQYLTKINMAASDNDQGVSWDTASDNFLQKSVSIGYDPKIAAVSVSAQYEKVVNGIGGSAITFPTPDDVVPYPTPPPGPEPEVPGPEMGNGFGTVYVATPNTLGRTREFSASSPSWSDITPSVSGDIWDFILDPWSPATTGYLSTDDGLYKSTTLDFDSPDWELVLSDADAMSATGSGKFDNPAKVIASINVEGYVVLFFSNKTTGNMYCVYSYDGFSTYSTSFIQSTKNGQFVGGVDYVPHLVNGGVVLYCGSARAQRLRINVSLDGGATWTEYDTGFAISSFADAWPVAGHCPYNGNESGLIAYMMYYHERLGVDKYVILRTSDGGSTTSTLVPLTEISSANTTLSKRVGVETYTLDNQQVYYWGAEDTPNSFWLSEDGGASFSNIVPTGLTGRVYANGGFPTNESQFYALTNLGIYVSTDRGTSFVDKTGDWAFGLDFPNVGKGTIVPLWTE